MTLDSVNPVTGRAEPFHADIMAGMSDEQKEYEAMKLVQQIDKLQRFVGAWFEGRGFRGRGLEV